ncbi:hypothetical protein ACFY3G_02030 [Streptomyces phaeochromogenes]|uniref:hypothetical protein n=1 Tax=Streptomyces phaeochromogenes TaxID=1923 RepID=UPI00369867A6
MTEWRDADQAPLPIPDKVPGLIETMTNRTGLVLHLQWDGERETVEILEARDLPDGRRALLVIVRVRRPGMRRVWVFWDPGRMSLANFWRNARAAAEAEPREGDAVAAGLDMTDCFRDDFTTYAPPRDVEVHIAGRWWPGRLRCRFNGPTEDRAVVKVNVSLWEPEWGAAVEYERMYRWDPAAIRM